jgi:hypothetical protein
MDSKSSCRVAVQSMWPGDLMDTAEPEVRQGKVANRCPDISIVSGVKQFTRGPRVEVAVVDDMCLKVFPWAYHPQSPTAHICPERYSGRRGVKKPHIGVLKKETPSTLSVAAVSIFWSQRSSERVAYLLHRCIACAGITIVRVSVSRHSQGFVAG